MNFDRIETFKNQAKSNNCYNVVVRICRSFVDRFVCSIDRGDHSSHLPSGGHWKSLHARTTFHHRIATAQFEINRIELFSRFVIVKVACPPFLFNIQIDPTLNTFSASLFPWQVVKRRKTSSHGSRLSNLQDQHESSFQLLINKRRGELCHDESPLSFFSF